MGKGRRVGGMSSSAAEESPQDGTIEWWSIPEVAAALGVRDGDVRGMISDRTLVAVRRDGRAPSVPAAFVVTDPRTGRPAVVAGLRGTIVQLADAGYSDDEIVAWLFRENDELGATPLQALTELRTHAVRRAAQALAF